MSLHGGTGSGRPLRKLTKFSSPNRWIKGNKFSQGTQSPNLSPRSSPGCDLVSLPVYPNINVTGWNSELKPESLISRMSLFIPLQNFFSRISRRKRQHPPQGA